MEQEDLAAFAAIVGPDGLLTEAADRAPFEVAARYESGKAAAVILPRTTEELSLVVARAVQRGIAIIPQAGNTGLVRGSVPDASGREVVISVARLRHPLHIDRANRSARVGAGVRLSELNTLAAESDLVLPIDLGADPMIGGMVATNTGGARFIKHGGMRARVLGLTAVLPNADGTIIALGSDLRKDNSRLDLRQLLIGSAGALGIVAEATIDLSIRPRQTAAALIVPTSAERVIDLLEQVEADVGDLLTAFEGMSREAMSAAFAHVPHLRNPFADGVVPDYAVIVELTCAMPPDVVDLGQVLEQCLAGIIGEPDTPIADALFGDAEAMWRLRHSLSEGVRALGSVMGFDLSFRRGDVFRFTREAKRRIEAAFPTVRTCDFGHVADGGVHFNIAVPVEENTRQTREQLSELVLGLAIGDFRGSFSAEHGLGRSNQHFYDRYVPEPVRAYSGRVVDIFADMPIGAARYGVRNSSD
jgi:FAD/FMN-containing dehydrogenase